MGHAGCLIQDAKGYRTLKEVEEWKARCPLATYRQNGCWRTGLITQDEIKAMEKQIDAELDEAFDCARRDPASRRPQDLPPLSFLRVETDALVKNRTGIP